MSSEKLDLVKELGKYYRAKREPEIVDLGEGKYLVVEGKGSPRGAEFQEKVKAIFSVAYAVRSAYKREGRDFKVPKLEGSWWVESGKPFEESSEEEWVWKLMIRVPDYVEEGVVKEAKARVAEKKGIGAAREVRLKVVEWGRCIQALHVGPYEREAETIARIREYAEKEGVRLVGPHHEVYISDPRKTPPEKLKTIIRYRVSQ